MKYVIVLIVGIIIGWWFTLCYSDNQTRKEAKIRLYQTEEGENIKIKLSADSLISNAYNDVISENTKMRTDLIQLSAQYKEYTSEGIARRIIEIVSPKD